MRKLGQNPTEAELIEMINSVDDNGDHEIDFEEFLILMKSRIGERDPERELKDAFAIFDTDGSGSIDRKELKRLMKKLGQALTEAELDAMMDEVDSDGDGVISFKEFKAMMVRWSQSWISFLPPYLLKTVLTVFLPFSIRLRKSCSRVIPCRSFKLPLQSISKVLVG